MAQLRNPEVLPPIESLDFSELLSPARIQKALEQSAPSAETRNAFITGAVVGAVGGYFVKGPLGMLLGAGALWYMFGETLEEKKTPPPKKPLGACRS